MGSRFASATLTVPSLLTGLFHDMNKLTYLQVFFLIFDNFYGLRKGDKDNYLEGFRTELNLAVAL